MIRPLAHDSARRLMEEDGIGYHFAVSQGSDTAHADASKNEVSIESVVAQHENLEVGMRDDRAFDPVAGTRFFSADCLHPYARVVTNNKDDSGGY
ncbi:MAG TPA: hypothetical protein VLW55_03995 [Burkholderiaceae bacterium]|nr:hypothetical protein [Burkholderiaceae bacterium]